jgi:hypothetical protein
MDAKKIIETAIDAWNARDARAFADAYDPECEITAPGGLVLRGAEGVEQFWHGYQDSFPDNRVVAHTVFGAADEGVQEAVFEGTHTGMLRGADGTEIPPTNRRVAVPFVGTYTMRGERVASYHLYFDQVELLTQLGLMPAGDAAQ